VTEHQITAKNWHYRYTTSNNSKKTSRSFQFF